jgi:hypothetical protein
LVDLTDTIKDLKDRRREFKSAQVREPNRIKQRQRARGEMSRDVKRERERERQIQRQRGHDLLLLS